MRCYKCGNVTDENGICKECGSEIMKGTLLFGYALSDVEVDLVSKAAKSVKLKSYVPIREEEEGFDIALVVEIHANKPKKRNIYTSKSYDVLRVRDLRAGLLIMVNWGCSCPEGLYRIVDIDIQSFGRYVEMRVRNIWYGREFNITICGEVPQICIDIEIKDMEYLFSQRSISGGQHYFRDTETGKKVVLESLRRIGDPSFPSFFQYEREKLKFVKEGMVCKVYYHNGRVFHLEPPLFVELEITETEPGFKCDTATGAFKLATVETGAFVYVPVSVEQGDVIKIDTRTGEYICVV